MSVDCRYCPSRSKHTCSACSQRCCDACTTSTAERAAVYRRYVSDSLAGAAGVVFPPRSASPKPTASNRICRYCDPEHPNESDLCEFILRKYKQPHMPVSAVFAAVAADKLAHEVKVRGQLDDLDVSWELCQAFLEEDKKCAWVCTKCKTRNTSEDRKCVNKCVEHKRKVAAPPPAESKQRFCSSCKAEVDGQGVCDNGCPPEKKRKTT